MDPWGVPPVIQQIGYTVLAIVVFCMAILAGCYTATTTVETIKESTAKSTRTLIVLARGAAITALLLYGEYWTLMRLAGSLDQGVIGS